MTNCYLIIAITTATTGRCRDVADAKSVRQRSANLHRPPRAEPRCPTVHANGKQLRQRNAILHHTTTTTTTTTTAAATATTSGRCRYVADEMGDQQKRTNLCQPPRADPRRPPLRAHAKQRKRRDGNLAINNNKNCGDRCEFYGYEYECDHQC